MIYEIGTKLVDAETGDEFFVTYSSPKFTLYEGKSGKGTIRTSEVINEFLILR